MSFHGEFRLGFLPLTDAAALIVADRRGLFEAEGLRVRLAREASWATLRDKLAAGLVDGAHMLAAVALASRLGRVGAAVDLIAPLSLNAHGAAVTLSAALAQVIVDGMDGRAPSAAPLRRVVEMRRTAGAAPLCFGVVLAISTHAHLLRDWLWAGGVDPDRDVRLRVLPPTAMGEALASGVLDGFCVGAPWSAAAEASGAGVRVLDGGQLQPFGPDKVFAVSEAWAARNDAALQALLRALIRASRWCDDPANRDVLLELLSEPDAVGAEPAMMAEALAIQEPARRLTFAHGGLGRPNPAHGLVLLEKLRRWNGLEQGADATGFYRADLYDRAIAMVDGPKTPSA